MQSNETGGYNKMKEKFIDWNPNKISLFLLDKIQDVLISYKAQGYSLTLRQLYYQLVARDLLPESWADKSTGSTNNPKSYKRLGHIVSQARLAGLIDWKMIEDRGRTVSKNAHWEDPKDILRAAAEQFYRSRWKNQEQYVFVMCEKDAVSNIIEPVCKRWDVQFMANKGYSSQSAIYRLYWQLRDKIKEGKGIYCIYAGDFDPSGLDMDRDIIDRMNLFFQDVDVFRDFIQVFPLKRIALTMEQIEKYRPPENPAKVTDSRFEKYAQEHGEYSWELDALEPAALEEIVETAIIQYVDIDEFDQVAEEEKKIKVKIKKFANKWGV